MSPLKGMTYTCALLWGLGVYAWFAGESTLGADLITFFGSITILLVAIQLVLWIKGKHGEQIVGSTVLVGHWVKQSRLMLLVLAGVLLVIWMFAYETLPGGWQHRNRITGFVCNIDRSCWFSAE